MRLEDQRGRAQLCLDLEREDQGPALWQQTTALCKRMHTQLSTLSCPLEEDMVCSQSCSTQ